MKKRLAVWALGLSLCPGVACAAQSEPSFSVLPDTLALGTGWFEIFRDTAYRDDADIRLEHRWGLSLLSAFSDTPSSLDPYFQIHPFVGVETTVRNNAYVFGGFIFDFLLGDHLFLSPNVAAGYYNQGSGKRLGCPLEFRSTAEAGWRFDSGWRLTAYVGHMSNAKMTVKNPGAEMAGGYIQIPFP